MEYMTTEEVAKYLKVHPNTIKRYVKDVIADDPRLIEIYLSIVKEMAIEHGVSDGKEAI